MSDHPTDLELELLRTGEAGKAVCDHLASCAPCQDRSQVFTAMARDQALSLSAVEIPPEIDLAIRKVARHQALRVRHQLQTRSLIRWASSMAAAAALILLVLYVPLKTKVESPKAAVHARADLNGDGLVDILDALTLARKVDQAEPERQWDINRDGRVDSRDVECIARAAVSLGGSPIG